MKETILKLKATLPCQDFIVTGSWVLAQCGLVPKSSVKDVDIILVKPTQDAIETLERFMTEFPAKQTAKFKELKGKTKSPLQAMFMYDKVKVDFFTVDSFKEEVMDIEGIKCTRLDHIIQSKKGYGRIKDWLQLRDMARLFFKQEEFDAFLNNGYKSALREQY